MNIWKSVEMLKVLTQYGLAGSNMEVEIGEGKISYVLEQNKRKFMLKETSTIGMSEFDVLHAHHDALFKAYVYNNM